MPNSIAVHRTWKSPPSNGPRLIAHVVARDQLTRADREAMYRLLECYFQNTSFNQFARDLAEKDTAILLRDPSNDAIAGFSTLMKLPIRVEDREVIGFFSGDTIVARECWGSSLLGRLWLATVFAEADRIRKHSPDTLFYWFLISSGYKTWRYLPIFFQDYSPHPQFEPSRFDRHVLHTLAANKFGGQYHPAEGVVRFRHANPLRPGVAEVTPHRLRDPLVEFFLKRNPGHAAGDELACLAPISRSNLTPAGHRLLAAGGAE